MTTSKRLERALIGVALAGVVAACSGGGAEPGPVAPPTTLSFTTSGSTVGELGGTATATVVLTTSLVETGSDIQVDIVDLGTGTATSGVDYAPFSTQTVVFPAGSISGESRTVLLTTTGDTIAEGADETIRLGLQNPSGAPLGSLQQSVITIQDAHVASIAFQAPSTMTPDEATTSYSVTVLLDITAGGTLGFDAEVLVSDDATGDATSGVDYDPFLAQTVQFPAGSIDGASTAFSVSVVDDADAEGPEFFALHFTGPGLDDLGRNGPTRHIVTITDDEVPPTPAFSGTYGPSGNESSMASTGGAIDLGSQTNGAGPTAGTQVIISNLGGGAMQLGTPILSGTNASDFVVEVEAASTEGGMRTSAAVPPLSNVVDMGAPFAPRSAGAAAGNGGALPDPYPGLSVTVDEAAITDLTLVDRVRLHGFPVPGHGDVTLELTRIPLPFTRDAVVSIDGVAVAGGPATFVSDLSTWRGTALELDGSRVFMAFSSAGPRGFLELDATGDRVVHLTPEEPATASSPASCRIVHEADLVGLPAADRPALCGGPLAPPGYVPDLALDPPAAGLEPESSGSEPPPSSGATTIADCRLAIETDYQFFQKFGTSQGVTDYVTSLVAAISGQYFEDVQTTLSIAYLGIYTTSSDPWTTPDTGGDTADMLNEFRTAWVGSGWPASADLAHFLSGANLGGGRAYLNVLCSQTFGFGVSGNLNGNINWLTWTGTAGSFTWDFVVVAHELGHNFGASHTHEYCPPLDECYAGTCVGSTTCSQGTMMSYCHTCGGMNNIDLHFHPNIANIMRQRVDASCLGDAVMMTGDSVRYRLRFDPRSGIGAKSATLTFDHDAPNATDPFPILLSGTSN